MVLNGENLQKFHKSNKSHVSWHSWTIMNFKQNVFNIYKRVYFGNHFSEFGWDFTFDCIYFILNDYDEAKDFNFSLSEFKKSLEKYFVDNHISWFNGECKVNMKYRMYRTKFVTLRCLYQEILSIHCRISESKVFQKYETIVRHMRDVFFIINQLKENKFNDEDDNARLLLEEYYKNTHMYIIG